MVAAERERNTEMRDKELQQNDHLFFEHISLGVSRSEVRFVELSVKKHLALIYRFIVPALRINALPVSNSLL